MKALIWKEWREHRIFLLMAVGILLCINIGSIIYLNVPSKTLSPIDKLEDIYQNIFLGLGWMILPALFALVLGATSFSKEFSNNTQDFLIQRPIGTAKIFWLKFFFGIILLLLVIQLYHLVLPVPYSFLVKELSPSDVKYHYFTFFYFFFIFVYSASFLSSLLVKRDLPAMVFSVLSIGIGILYIFPLYLILFIIFPPGYLAYLFSFKMEIFLTTYILFVGFTLFSFLLWQKAISKGVKSSKIFFTVTGIIFLVYLVTYTILNISTSIELSKTLKQAKANGMKLTLEEIIPPPVPNEENAAFTYEKAFGLVNKLKRQYQDEWEYIPYEGKIWNDPMMLEKVTLEQKKRITQMLLEDEDFINLYALVEKAVNFPQCRFDLNYKEGFMMIVPHPQWIGQLAKLVSARTHILTEEKRHKEALESFLIGFKLEESLKDEPLLISQLVRIALNKIAMESIESLMNLYPKEISIEDYQKLISEIDKKEGVIKLGVESDLAHISNFVFKNLLRGKVDALYGIWGQPESEAEKILLIFYSYPGRPLLKQDYSFYVRCLTELMKLSRLPYCQAKDDIEALDRDIDYITREYAQLKYTFSIMLIPALNKSIIRQSECNAQLDGLKIACALKIYKKNKGYYPDSLVELAPSIISEIPLDEFTGENLIYRKQGNGFIVYSLGPNGKDDNGISQKENNEIQKGKEVQGRDENAYDIVWKCEE